MKLFFRLFAVVLVLFASVSLRSVFAVSENSNKPVCPGPNAPGNVRCHARVVTDSAGQPKAVTVPMGYNPQQFRAAYGVTGQSATPGTIIAVVDAYDNPNVYADLKTYSQQFGINVLPQYNGNNSPWFRKVDQRGGTAFPRTDAAWTLESALDTQIAHAMCDNCSILLVEADSSSFVNLMAAVDRARLMGAKVISNSYGAGEFSGQTAFDSHFNYPNLAITFSTGDSGYGAQYPAASPFVTAVGGTSLNMSGTTYQGETAWSLAGSGCSAFELKPGFQTDTLCTNRTIGDVSADADPNTGAAIFDSTRYQGKKGWFQVGGTSLSSPIIAGMYGLSGGVTGAGNALPYGNTAALRDITSGSNGSCGGTYLCTAVAGYDGPTGLGTPNGLGAF